MTVYWIDQVGGNDGNSGTAMATPWKTFTNLNALAPNTLQGGDEIRLKRGSVFTDFINFSPVVAFILGQPGGNPQNSSLTVPVKILPYGVSGAMPIIDAGGGAFIPIAVDGGAFWIEEIECKNSTGSNTTGIFIDFSSNAATPPACWILNCVVHDILGGDGISTGFGSSGNDATRTRIISGNHVYNIANDGISAFGNASGMIYEFNTIHNIAVGVPGLNSTSGDGITAHSSASGLIRRYNTIYDCVDGINDVNDGALENLIDSNWIYNCREHCIWPAASVSSLVSYQIRNNVIGMPQGMRQYGDWLVTCAGMTIGFPSGDFGLTVTDVVLSAKIYNNTFYNATPNCPSLHLITKGTNGNNSVWDVRNNVFKSNGIGRYVRVDRNTKTPTWTQDFNNFDIERPNAWEMDGASYATLAAWRTASSKDASSVAKDPILFGDPTVFLEGARLRRDSPARSLGANLSATFNNDVSRYIRAATGSWDAGAFKY